LCFLPQLKTIKFNIMLEILNDITYKKTKLIVGLKYLAEQKILRLITIF
jgi:hypothetical protein